MMQNQITLTFDGVLAPNHSVSLRTLAYTLPHIQRSIDKIVYFERKGEVRKFTSLPKELQGYADIYINELEEGSLRIPFVSDLAAKIPELYNAFLAESYERSAKEVVSHSKILQSDLEACKGLVLHDNAEPITQDDLIAVEGGRKLAYARTAVLKDINQALAIVRTTPGALLKLDVDSQKGYGSYLFDPMRAARFSKVVATKRLENPAVYIGQITGLEQQGATSAFKYAAKFWSRVTGQENKLMIQDYDDALKLHAHNLSNKDVAIWAAPISVHETFDPVRGDLVFIDILPTR
ncbi:hypothetical protein J1G18_13400 [Pseudomonas sp. MIS38]|uniref:hypothetical protein n=1 Tax=Pseudomonas sp. MIS38 TaxID=91465 RepID=UPI001CA6DE94|nr:hypothetical protein [Pseudomonas sp. MIS38]MBY8958284.1 hypothetical protein [Pseudomonas sp. MIS38]